MEAPTKCEVLEIVLAAISEPANWTKRSFGTLDGPKCVIGHACFVASGGLEVKPGHLDRRSPERYVTLDQVREALAKTLRERADGSTLVYEYNDRDDTTHEDIVSLVRETIERECQA